MPQNTLVRPYGTAGILEAAALIREGQTVAMPTETVYGVAADATNGEAVARIYQAKGRPRFNPLIVHVPDLAAAEAIGAFNDSARQLAEAHWPGPLTLVVPHKSDSAITSLVTAGLSTIAIRVPAHRAMRSLLIETGLPLAAPSANVSGAISPTRTEHVLNSLNGRIAMIIDDGPTTVGIESTIIACDAHGLRLLRHGPIVIPEATTVQMDGHIEAPGQLASHYAPAKPLQINIAKFADDAFRIGFGDVACDFNLSPRSNLIEAAARLFDALHQADASDRPHIQISAVPDDGIGASINDRLIRAAA
jgi:L-threonylcarbamoyladenylate synthase